MKGTLPGFVKGRYWMPQYSVLHSKQRHRASQPFKILSHAKETFKNLALDKNIHTSTTTASNTKEDTKTSGRRGNGIYLKDNGISVSKSPD